ncbi:MAG: amino acid ABC transporter permease [Burkholderiales bacterium]
MRFVASHRIAPAPPPLDTSSALQKMRRLFFNSTASSIVTLVLATLSIALAWQIVTWGLLDAVFTTHGRGPDACRAAGAGACWAVIGEKLRLVLFGLYPHSQHWRPASAIVLLIVMYGASVQPRMWNWRLPAVWFAALAAVGVLMWGGVFGLPSVPDDQWGGLPVTLILATLGLATGFPLAIMLALLRHSPRRGVGKALAVAYIELTRSVPLLAVLFFASVMIPLFLPQGIDVSKLLRVFVAFALFIAAYLAEVVRGGLLSIPKGQVEAARALGLTRYVVTTRIVLPQALMAVIPAIVNVFIAFFKATSIVVVVGIFDLMTAANRAAADPAWQGFGTEIYLFVAAIYFAFCFAMSRASTRLQAPLDRERSL